MAIDTGKSLVLTLGLALGVTACDQPAESGPEVEEQTWRTGSGDHGRRLTLNTNAWIPASARDLHEFRDNGDKAVNGYDFESKFMSIHHPNTAYGPLTTPVKGPVSGATIKLHPDGHFQFEVRGPNNNDPEYMLTGAALLGLQLNFEMKDPDFNEYDVVLVVTGHMTDEHGNDLYEFSRANPQSEVYVPLCEESEDYGRFARVTNRLHIEGLTGDVDIQAPSLRHIGCLASVPAKAMQLGYSATTGELDEFVLATRIVRADYCADGHPYTFPGNLFSTEDNREGMTLGDVEGTLGPNEEIEAMWDVNGVLCVNTPRAFNISRQDIVCPTKRLTDGSLVHNWQPPSCEGYVDDPDPGLRMYSVTSVEAE